MKMHRTAPNCTELYRTGHRTVVNYQPNRRSVVLKKNNHFLFIENTVRLVICNGSVLQFGTVRCNFHAKNHKWTFWSANSVQKMLGFLRNIIKVHCPITRLLGSVQFGTAWPMSFQFIVSDVFSAVWRTVAVFHVDNGNSNIHPLFCVCCVSRKCATDTPTRCDVISDGCFWADRTTEHQ